MEPVLFCRLWNNCESNKLNNHSIYPYHQEELRKFQKVFKGGGRKDLKNDMVFSNGSEGFIFDVKMATLKQILLIWDILTEVSKECNNQMVVTDYFEEDFLEKYDWKSLIFQISKD